MSSNFVANKRKIRGSKNEKRLSTIALILVLTMAMAFATLVPAVEAAGIDTQAILMVGTNPIGVSQTLLVIYGVNMPPPGATAEPNTPKWEGLKVTITKPDRTTETKGPFKSDSTGTNYLFYLPKMVGTYYFQTSFPGQTIAGIYYNPSTSTNVSLTVQAEPIPSYPVTELPTYYWSRPIESQNREWWSISGNWLALGGGSHGVGSYGPDSSAFNPYTKAPNTAHIMWTKELAMGGLVGGEQGAVGYYGGQPYSARFHPPIIINGRLFYNIYPVGEYGGYPGFTCVDLRTGETLWTNKSAVISKGQATNFDSVNEYGVRPPILWSTVGSTWYAYDAFRGDLLFSLKNAQSGGTFAMDAKGNMQVYILNSAKNWLAMWNSTRAMPIEQTPVTGRWYLKPGTYDWLKGIEWNVTVPDTPGEPALGNINSLINPTVVIAEAFIPETVGNPVQTFVQVAYSLKKGEEGRQLWIANRTDIGERARRENYRNLIANDVFIVYHREKMQYNGYVLQTGEQLWTSDPYNTNDWAVFTRTADAAYGKLLTEGMDGYVVAFDVKTGKLLWKTNPSEGDLVDAPYGHNSFSTHSGKVIADGKY